MNIERIAIVGSRDYPDLEAVKHFVEALPPNVTVVSGGARGVDRTAEDTARARGMKVVVFLADWANEGRSAGYKRNVKVVNAADMVVAFWDGKSPGTRHAIELARKLNRPLLLFGPSEKICDATAEA